MFLITYCHSRNKGLYEVIVCTAVSAHAKVFLTITVCRVLGGSLGQEVEHAYLMAIV